MNLCNLPVPMAQLTIAVILDHPRTRPLKNKELKTIRQQPALSLFAIGLIGLGTLSVIYRDFHL
jgi:hypothetical protein